MIDRFLIDEYWVGYTGRNPEIREFDMQHEQWLFGGEQYTAPVLKAIDEFMEMPADR